MIRQIKVLVERGWYIEIQQMDMDKSFHVVVSSNKWGRVQSIKSTLDGAIDEVFKGAKKLEVEDN